MTKNTSQNFNLSPSQFEELCRQLREGQETIMERIFLKHYDYCKKYLTNKVGANKDEAHEAIMYALLKFRRGLIKGEIQYDNLRSLFNEMAYYKVLRLRKKTESDQEHNLKYLNASATDEVDTCDCQQKTALSQCIEALNEPEKKLLVDHFYKNMKLTMIAESSNVSAEVIRKRKQRIIDKLKVMFESKSYTDGKTFRKLI